MSAPSPELYCSAMMRLNDPSKAAEEVGYSGPASPTARSLWDRVEMLLDDMSTCPDEAALVAGIEQTRAKVARLRERMRADAEWLRAVRFARAMEAE